MVDREAAPGLEPHMAAAPAEITGIPVMAADLRPRHGPPARIPRASARAARS
jgi:hypothetical protein